MPKAKKPIKQTFKTIKDRQAALQKAMSDKNKELGIKALQCAEFEEDWDRAKFGVEEIDEMLGGGIPHGKFSVVWGGEGCGKSTMAYCLTAQAQQEGKIVYYIDLENSFDKKRASQFGVNLQNVAIGHFPKAEQCLDTIVQFARQGLVDVIVLDSIHSLAPTGEQETKQGKEKSIDDDSVALLARKLAQFFRVAIDPVARNKVAVLLIGQTRIDVGFISMEKLTGGKALRHYSTLILHARKGQKADAPVRKEKITVIDENEKEKKKTVKTVIGFDMSIQIDKTKVPDTKQELTKVHMPFYFETGFDKPNNVEKPVEKTEEIENGPKEKS